MGETFHLVKFLPGCCRELWSLPLPARTQGDSALRLEPGNSYGSWSSLGLGIRGKSACGVCMLARSSGSSLSCGGWLQVDLIRRLVRLAGACNIRGKAQMPMDALAGPRGTSWVLARRGYVRSREASLHFHRAGTVAQTVRRSSPHI